MFTTKISFIGNAADVIEQTQLSDKDNARGMYEFAKSRLRRLTRASSFAMSGGHVHVFWPFLDIRVSLSRNVVWTCIYWLSETKVAKCLHVFFFFWNFFQRFEILKRLETNFYSTLDNFLLLVKFKIVFLREIKEKKKKLYASRNLIKFFFSLILDY